MRLLLIEDTADGLLDLAVIAKRLGHDARYFCRTYDAVKAPAGRGLVERVADWRPSMRWADLVVVGGNGKWMLELDRWRAEGVPIIGYAYKAGPPGPPRGISGVIEGDDGEVEEAVRRVLNAEQLHSPYMTCRSIPETRERPQSPMNTQKIISIIILVLVVV